ncbi:MULTISPECIES: DUF308 domain-containing protein [unclassified Granulicatella]|uniref:DUF308 domain-containing protein n=1 Tax=unclassified Granulicatella TaxID=2630493 RepID=UPI0010742D63|nr:MULTISPECIES: DUF308 domain-containing protein [unclassified Granulicatella]MBF0780775.1 DUF308 domain-containing protein [Granulicatella sp. 19428wC4_WM01]TFU93848.1 hypothetical protein E4T68_06645 [Granulicatella sp. WM01]
MITNLKYFKWFLLISGILFILVGCITLFNPISQLATLGFSLAIAWLIGGIVDVIEFFTIDNPFRSKLYLINAILNIIFSLLLLSGGYTTFTLLLPTLVAYWLILISIFQLVSSILLNIENFLKSSFFWYALIGLIVGVFLLYHPLFTGLIVSLTITFSFIQQGIHAITRFLSLSKIV